MTIKIVISITFLLSFCWSSVVLGNINNKILSEEQIEEFQLAFAQANALAPSPPPANDTNYPNPCHSGGACKDMVEKYGYKCEEHTVTTKDGHILSMQRIPATKHASLFNSSKPKKSHPPVLLQHGLFCDGIAWMSIEKDSLAFYLADKGFDVWVNNNRGTKYSRCHKWLSVAQRKFWDFSWQELSEIDLDATVNYVHKNTKQNVHYVGHSRGTMVALGALAAHQPTIKKMRSVALLAPIAHMKFLYSIFGRVTAELFLAEIRDFVKPPECNPVGRIPAAFAAKACKMFHLNCVVSLWFATGPNCCVDKDTFIRFVEHEPQSTSSKVLQHLSQNIRGGGMAKFDYCLLKNMVIYKKPVPTPYVLENIPKDFPIFLGYGALDSLADIIDVLRLINDLTDHDSSKLVLNFQLFYAHMDYIMARKAKTDVYEPIVSFFYSN